MRHVRTALAGGLVVLLAALAVIGPAGAATEERRGTYLVPGPPDGGYVDNVGGYGIGGYLFAAGGIPRAIKIEDVTGDPIGFKVCQDWNDDGICGNNEEFQHCSAGKVTIPSALGYRANVPTTVFIRNFDLDCEQHGVDPGQAMATTGDIVLFVE